MTLEEKFWEFHTHNPHVYRKLRELALQAKRRGMSRLGMKALFERFRWWSNVETRGDEYKLNNNYTAFYARLLMDLNEELKGFFELRMRKARAR